MEEFTLDQVSVSEKTDVFGNQTADIEIKKTFFDELSPKVRTSLETLLDRAKEDGRRGRDYWLMLIGFLGEFTSREICELTFMEASVFLHQYGEDLDYSFSKWCRHEGLRPDDVVFRSHVTNSPLSPASLYRIINRIINKKKGSKRKKGGITFLKGLRDFVFNNIFWRLKVLLETGYLPHSRFKSEEEYQEWKEMREIKLMIESGFG
ncbi:hypothetical protein GF420_15630 [candidate division GN15 bacterium]|nr:hypothetical protein [candidate division GN15 bacterium]